MPRDAGVMPCVSRIRGECPYRDAMRCSDSDRSAGIEQGRCVIELARRDALLKMALRDVEWLPAKDRPYFAQTAMRWAAARVYFERALTWLGIVTATKFEDVHGWAARTALRTATRYYETGDALTWRLMRRLLAMQRTASGRKAAGWVAKAHADVNRKLKELDPTFGEPLKLLDLIQRATPKVG